MTDDAETPASDCDGLCAHLAASQATAVTLGFDDIGELRGETLPEAAGKDSAWWANDPAQPQAARGWLAAGWRAALVDLKARTVTFARRPAPK